MYIKLCRCEIANLSVIKLYVVRYSLVCIWFLLFAPKLWLLKMMQFGYIVLTTSAGIMDHEEARRKNVGGKVLGFFY